MRFDNIHHTVIQYPRRIFISSVYRNTTALLYIWALTRAHSRHFVLRHHEAVKAYLLCRTAKPPFWLYISGWTTSKRWEKGPSRRGLREREKRRNQPRPPSSVHSYYPLDVFFISCHPPEKSCSPYHTANRLDRHRNPSEALLFFFSSLLPQKCYITTPSPCLCFPEREQGGELQAIFAPFLIFPPAPRHW